MKVNLKCFSTLGNDAACDYGESTVYELTDGQTVADAAMRAGVAREDVKIVFVNNRKSDLETVLKDGDQIGLAPAVGGM